MFGSRIILCLFIILIPYSDNNRYKIAYDALIKNIKADITIKRELKVTNKQLSRIKVSKELIPFNGTAFKIETDSLYLNSREAQNKLTSFINEGLTTSELNENLMIIYFSTKINNYIIAELLYVETDEGNYKENIKMKRRYRFCLTFDDSDNIVDIRKVLLRNK